MVNLFNFRHKNIDNSTWDSDKNAKRIKFLLLIEVGELLKCLWDRDFDVTKDKTISLKGFDKLKERYNDMRNELCHNLHRCLVDTKNIETMKGKRKLIKEINYLTGKKNRDYLLGLLKITKLTFCNLGQCHRFHHFHKCLKQTLLHIF